MHGPSELYHIEALLGTYLPQLRPAQRTGLAWWVLGTLKAGSACQSAVLAALAVYGSSRRALDARRQRLREWFVDGADKAKPCQVHLDVAACFPALLRWVLSWWHSDHLALAIDATLQGDRLCALVVSVLYRGCAIPVAWAILPATRPGAWLPRIFTLLEQLQPAVPPQLTVLVLADRGLWSPRLYDAIRGCGWHPLLRVQDTVTFAPAGRDRCRSRTLVRQGEAWVGRGKLGSPKKRRLAVTLIGVWTADQADPWVVVTDLPPAAVGVSWYGLRMWVELGFRVLKSVGWRWAHPRRRDPRRVARHWLVLAVATLLTLAAGTRVEDAQGDGVPPGQLRAPRPSTAPGGRRRSSVFRVGLSWLQHLVGRGRWWRRWWLVPEPWPDAPPEVTIYVHSDLGHAYLPL
jgi:hypothetical protein